MPRPVLQDLLPLGPAIKREWKNLLSGEPVLTPLGRPDTLVFLMDATLAQLSAGLEKYTQDQWLRACTPVIAPVHAHCACGLNPLLKYFATGELALRAIAGPVMPGEIEGVLQLFRSLAEQEVKSLCGACHHQGIPGCCERPAK